MIVLDWLAERVSPRVFVPLAFGLALGAGVPSWSGTLAALTMVIAFRLRDDLADAATDPPDRVIPRARSKTPFWLGYLVLLALCARGNPGVLLLAAAFEVAYRSGLGGRHRWVLLKYPAFVFLLGGRRPSVLLLAYLVVATHERMTDPGLRRRPGNLLRVAACLVSTVLALVVAILF